MCRDGQLSLEESWRVPSPEDVVQSSETGTDALSRAEEEQNLAERPEDELEAMQARRSMHDIPVSLLRLPVVLRVKGSCWTFIVLHPSAGP